HAGQDEGAGRDPTDPDTREPGGLRVAADAVEVAAHRRVLQQPPQHDPESQHVKDRQRQAPEEVLTYRREMRGDPVGNRAAIGNPVGTSGQDAAHAERCDERVDVQLDHDERVDQPDQQPGYEGDDDAEGEAMAVGLEPDDDANRNAYRAAHGQVERITGHRHDQ